MDGMAVRACSTLEPGCTLTPAKLEGGATFVLPSGERMAIMVFSIVFRWRTAAHGFTASRQLNTRESATLNGKPDVYGEQYTSSLSRSGAQCVQAYLFWIVADLGVFCGLNSVPVWRRPGHDWPRSARYELPEPLATSPPKPGGMGEGSQTALR